MRRIFEDHSLREGRGGCADGRASVFYQNKVNAARREGRERRGPATGSGGLEGDGRVPELGCGDGCTTLYEVMKNVENVCLQWVRFMVCKLYFLGA